MHGGWFPNFFKSAIPLAYFAEGAPTPYKLCSLDANFLRNAGFSFSLFAVFLVAWLLVSLVVVVFYKVCKRREIFYPKIMKQALFAGI